MTHQEGLATSRPEQAPHFLRCLVDCFLAFFFLQNTKKMFLAIARRIAVVDVVFPQSISTVSMIHSFP